MRGRDSWVRRHPRHWITHEKAPEEGNQHEELGEVAIIERVCLDANERQTPQNNPYKLHEERDERREEDVRVPADSVTRGNQDCGSKPNALANQEQVADT